MLLHALCASQSAFDGGNWPGLCALCVASSVLSCRCCVSQEPICTVSVLWSGPTNLRLRAAGIAGICWDWGCWVDPWQRVRVRREKATLESGSQHQQQQQRRMRQQFEMCRQSAEEGSQSEPTTAAAPRQANRRVSLRAETWMLDVCGWIGCWMDSMEAGVETEKSSPVRCASWELELGLQTGRQRALAASVQQRTHSQHMGDRAKSPGPLEGDDLGALGALWSWFSSLRRPRLGRERRRASHLSRSAHPAAPRPLVARRPALHCAPSRYSDGTNVKERNRGLSRTRRC